MFWVWKEPRLCINCWRCVSSFEDVRILLQKRTTCGVDGNMHCRRYHESVAALVSLTPLQVNVPTDVYVFIYLFTNEREIRSPCYCSEAGKDPLRKAVGWVERETEREDLQISISENIWGWDSFLASCLTQGSAFLSLWHLRLLVCTYHSSQTVPGSWADKQLLLLGSSLGYLISRYFISVSLGLSLASIAIWAAVILWWPDTFKIRTSYWSHRGVTSLPESSRRKPWVMNWPKPPPHLPVLSVGRREGLG